MALLLALADGRSSSGLVLSAVHVHHGLRGAESDADEQFVRELAARLHLPLRVERGSVPALAAEHGQGVEEAARHLRYGIFERLLAAHEVDAVATAHTLDDQAETVLMKLLRGAWTEGLSGIAPVMELPGGRIVRPLLEVSREEVIAFLAHAGQDGAAEAWREDSSNAELAHTRNRIRHTLLPALRAFNPQIATQLARMAAVARDEEAWWQAELARTLPGLLLPGRAARGGGRTTSTHPEQASVSLEVERLRNLHRAVQRRAVRAAARQLGANLSADAVEALLAMAGLEESGARATVRKLDRSGAAILPGGVRAERTPRELRLSLPALQRAKPAPQRGTAAPQSVTDEGKPARPVYALAVPGSVKAEIYGLLVTAAPAVGNEPGSGGSGARPPLQVRAWKAGDRITLQYSRSSKKVTEALDRMKIYGSEREGWPVVARGSRVLWMRGVVVDPPVLREEALELSVQELSVLELSVTELGEGAASREDDATPLKDTLPSGDDTTPE